MPIRVLVVDDSLTVRKRLCDALAADPECLVVGEAADGKRGIELCQQLRPDVITMDMMMPSISGLGATEYIMAHCPTPILIVSASTNRGELFKTYEALAAGAVDVLEKPRSDSDDDAWDRLFRSTVKLVSRIRVITHVRARLGGITPERTAAPPITTEPSRCQVVLIGASTGGPGAIRDVLRALPSPFPLPILLVMHIGEPFGASFAEWLDGQTGIRVAYAIEGAPVSSVAGRVAMAPPDYHLSVRNGRMRLTQDLPRHSCRPSVDVLFESAAADYGASVAAVLLTGMGRDGATGLLQIRRSGGLTIAQDEATSVVYGMPREAVLIGAAMRELPLPHIGPALADLIKPSGQRPTP